MTLVIVPSAPPRVYSKTDDIEYAANISIDVDNHNRKKKKKKNERMPVSTAANAPAATATSAPTKISGTIRSKNPLKGAVEIIPVSAVRCNVLCFVAAAAAVAVDRSRVELCQLLVSAPLHSIASRSVLTSTTILYLLLLFLLRIRNRTISVSTLLLKNNNCNLPLSIRSSSDLHLY
jgi:hypothetical protein